MSLSQFATERPVTILMVVAGVLLFGAIAFDALGLDLLPDLSYPVNAIITVYPNADAETIEKAVSAKIEDAISTVSNLRRIDSMSSENISVVVAEFNWRTDLTATAQEIAAAIDALQYTLPSAVQKPIVMQLDPSQIPIALIGLSSDTLSLEELTRLAKEELIPIIERTPGVATTSIAGGVGRQVSVMYDPAKLEEIGISDTLLAQMIGAQNVFVPIGSVYEDGKRYMGKVGMEINSIDELKRLVVGVTEPEESGVGGLLGMALPAPVYLEDVADIALTTSEREGITRVNGRAAVLITVMKRSGENTVLVSERLEQTLSDVTAKLDQVEIHYITDQAQFIQRSVNDLSANGIAGGIIAAAVLYIFLRRLSSTLIVSLAIPLSVLVTFILMYLRGLTLNIMTLGGLALGVGMLVDNSIVVLEAIHRHRELGQSPKEAAVNGAAEVTSAIVASTLTTLAVFLPIIFLKSFAGYLFTDLSLTVSFSLLASLLVALTVVPALASKARWRGAPATTIGAGLSAISLRYRRALAWSLEHKWAVLTVSVVLLIAALFALSGLETEFLPDMDMGMVEVNVILPPGTPVDRTSSVVADVESVLENIPGIHAYSSRIGGSDTSAILWLFSSLPSNRGRIDIMLKPNAERELSFMETVARISSAVEPVRALHQDARIEVHATDQIAYVTGLDQSALEINISGDDLGILRQLSNELAQRLESIEGIEHVEQSVESVQPIAFLDVNHARALTSRLTAGQVGLSVRSQLIGTTATELRLNGELIPVVLTSKDAVGKDLDSVLSLKVSSSLEAAGAGSSVGSEGSGLASKLTGPPTLGRITTPRQEMELTTIARADGVRTVTLEAYLSSLPLGTAKSLVLAEIDEMHIPEGYSIEFTGVSNIMQESLNSLKTALLVAMLLVYMVMAAQFESLMSPLIIMFSIPLAAIGSVFGLLLAGSRLGVMAVVGIIVLVGIVVNNAILMVDSINRLRKERRDLRSAILDAGTERLRPILMTALTTIVGLFPLAFGVGRYIGFGEGTETQKPLAVAVMGGLLSSTLLTLIVIPTIYELVHGWLMKRSKAQRPPILPVLVVIFLTLIGTLAACAVLPDAVEAASPVGVGGSVPKAALPGPLKLPTFDFKGAFLGFGFVHAEYDPAAYPFPSFANLLIAPEVKLQTNNTTVVAGVGVSLQYNPSAGRLSAGLTSSVKLTKRRMVQFGVFRDEILTVSYQWLPGRIPGGADELAIARRNDRDRAGAIALAAGIETTLGRVALKTLASFASPTFDLALAKAAHEFPVVRPGEAGVSCTVRWHQHTSVATICRGSISIDLEDTDITYVLAGGVYGSPLPWLDYSVLIGAEAGVRATTPVVDIQVTYKDFLRSGSRLILEIHNETGMVSASLRAKWPLL